MRLSLRALEICRVKYGKGIFCGMEPVEESYFDELAEHVTDKHKNRRHLVLINEPHVAKIPQAVIFADGKRIVLNAD